MQRRLKRKRETMIKKVLTERVERGFSKLESCFEQMKIFSTRFDCSMRILTTLPETLDCDDFSQELSTETLFTATKVVYDKKMFCVLCRHGEHFEQEIIESDYSMGECRCQKGATEFSMKSEKEQRESSRKEKKSNKSVKETRNVFEFDSERNNNGYSLVQSGDEKLSQKAARSKEKASSKQLSRLSEISKTEEGELLSDREFEKMKKNKVYEKRITFGLGDAHPSKLATKEPPKSIFETQDFVPYKEENANLEQAKSESKNDIQNQIENFANMKKIFPGRNSRFARQHTGKKLLRGETTDNEDLYQSVSVDMSFDIQLAKLEKEERRKKQGVNLLMEGLKGLESDCDAPAKSIFMRRNSKHGEIIRTEDISHTQDQSPTCGNQLVEIPEMNLEYKGNHFMKARNDIKAGNKQRLFQNNEDCKQTELLETQKTIECLRDTDKSISNNQARGSFQNRNMGMRLNIGPKKLSDNNERDIQNCKETQGNMLGNKWQAGFAEMNNQNTLKDFNVDKLTIQPNHLKKSKTGGLSIQDNTKAGRFSMKQNSSTQPDQINQKISMKNEQLSNNPNRLKFVTAGKKNSGLVDEIYEFGKEKLLLESGSTPRQSPNSILSNENTNINLTRQDVTVGNFGVGTFGKVNSVKPIFLFDNQRKMQKIIENEQETNFNATNSATNKKLLKSKSGILGQRDSQNRTTVKLYKPKTVTGLSGAYGGIERMHSISEQSIGHFRKKSFQESNKMIDQLGTNQTQARDLEEGGNRELGNFPKEPIANVPVEFCETGKIQNLGDGNFRKNSEMQKLRNINNANLETRVHSERIISSQRNYQNHLSRGQNNGNIMQANYGPEIFERVITEQSRFAETTVEKVLAHGQKNTQILKEAFKDFLIGFGKVEEGSSDDSDDSDNRSVSRKRRQLKREEDLRQELEKEKALRRETQSKFEKFKRKPRSGNEVDWEGRAYRAIVELDEKSKKAKVLESSTRELFDEIAKLKRNLETRERSQGKFDPIVGEQNGKSLPKFIYIKSDMDRKRRSSSFRISRREREREERRDRSRRHWGDSSHYSTSRLSRHRENGYNRWEKEPSERDRTWRGPHNKYYKDSHHNNRMEPENVYKRSYHRLPRRSMPSKRLARSLIDEWVPYSKRQSGSTRRKYMDKKHSEGKGSQFSSRSQRSVNNQMNNPSYRESTGKIYENPNLERSQTQRIYKDEEESYFNRESKRDGVTQTLLRGSSVYDQQWVNNLEIKNRTQNQISAKLISKMETEIEYLTQKNSNLNEDLAAKENEIGDLKERISDMERRLEKVSAMELIREREWSFGCRDSKLENQLRFQSFNQNGGLQVDDLNEAKTSEILIKEEDGFLTLGHEKKMNNGSGNFNEGLIKQDSEVVEISSKKTTQRNSQKVEINSDLLKFLYSQACLIDETFTLQQVGEKRKETEYYSDNNQMYYESGGDDISHPSQTKEQLEPIHELTEDRVSSKKQKTEVSYRDSLEHQESNKFSGEKSRNRRSDKGTTRLQWFDNKESETHREYSKSRDYKIHTRNSQIRDGYQNQPDKQKPTTMKPFEKQKTEMRSEKKQQLVEEINQNNFEEYISEGGSHYFVNGNLILKIDSQGKIISQKVITDSFQDSKLEFNSNQNLFEDQSGEEFYSEANQVLERAPSPQFKKPPSGFLENNKTGMRPRLESKITKESLNGKNYSDDEEDVDNFSSRESGKFFFADITFSTS